MAPKPEHQIHKETSSVYRQTHSRVNKQKGVRTSLLASASRSSHSDQQILNNPGILPRPKNKLPGSDDPLEMVNLGNSDSLLYRDDKLMILIERFRVYADPEWLRLCAKRGCLYYATLSQ